MKPTVPSQTKAPAERPGLFLEPAFSEAEA
jgi:hypothetical protein